MKYPSCIFAGTSTIPSHFSDTSREVSSVVPCFTFRPAALNTTLACA